MASSRLNNFKYDFDSALKNAEVNKQLRNQVTKKIFDSLKDQIEQFNKQSQILHNKKTTDKKIISYVEKIYELSDFGKPLVLVAKDPIEYQTFCKLLNEEKELFRFFVFLKQNRHRFEWIYQLIQKINKQYDISPTLYFKEKIENLYQPLSNQLKENLKYLFKSSNWNTVYNLYSIVQNLLNTEKIELKNDFTNIFQIDDQLISDQFKYPFENGYNYEIEYLISRNSISDMSSQTITQHLSHIYSVNHLCFQTICKQKFIITFLSEYIKPSKNIPLINHIYDNYQPITHYIFSNNVAIVLKNTVKEIKSNNRLHNLNGPALKWDNYGIYFINNRVMPSWIFEKGFIKEQFLTEKNEDIRAGMYEILKNKGEKHLMNFLGARIIDKQDILHKDGSMETLTLYQTKETFPEEEDLHGNGDCPLAWLEMICPSTKTHYLIPTDSSFKNVIDSAKYHRPERIPNEILYEWDSRN